MKVSVSVKLVRAKETEYHAGFVHHISTLTPPFAYHQDFARDRPGRIWRQMSARSASSMPSATALRHRDARHSVYGDFLPVKRVRLFKFDDRGVLIPPTTGQRNAVYAEWSRKLAVELAGKLLTEVRDSRRMKLPRRSSPHAPVS